MRLDLNTSLDICLNFSSKHIYTRLEHIEIFFDIAELYPPISTFENQPESSDQEPSTSTA